MTALQFSHDNSSRRCGAGQDASVRRALANRHVADHRSAKIAGRLVHFVGSSRVALLRVACPQHATHWQEPCPLIQSIRCTQ